MDPSVLIAICVCICFVSSASAGALLYFFIDSTASVIGMFGKKGETNTPRQTDASNRQNNARSTNTPKQIDTPNRQVRSTNTPRQTDASNRQYNARSTNTPKQTGTLAPPVEMEWHMRYQNGTRELSQQWSDGTQYKFNTLKFEMDIPTKEQIVFSTKKDPIVKITPMGVHFSCDGGQKTAHASHDGSPGQKIIVIIESYQGFSENKAVIHTKSENSEWKSSTGKTGWWHGSSRGEVLVPSYVRSLEWYRKFGDGESQDTTSLPMLHMFVAELMQTAN